MKYRLGSFSAFVLLFLVTLASFAQAQSQPTANNVSSFGVSPNLRDIVETLVPPRPGPNEVREVPNPIYPDSKPSDVVDPVVQRGGLRDGPGMPDPIISFDALRSLDNFTFYGYRNVPPDTEGSVGPNHYVQFVNTLMRVYNKDGTPAAAPIKLSSLFRPIGGYCADPFDHGDPIVLYDYIADRWMASQFAFPVNAAGTPIPPFQECIAISTTSDPTGSYYIYDFPATPGRPFNDYPHFGLWPDAYYLSVNEGAGVTGAYAYDRAKLLAGDPTAQSIYFTAPGGQSKFLPASMAGTAVPPAGEPNYFVRYQGPSSLRIYEFHADFQIVANSTFTERSGSPLSVAPFLEFGPICFGGTHCITQPGTTTYLEAIGDRMMHFVQYRNFGTYEALVTNHTVNVNTPPDGRAGIRYYELRRVLPGGNFDVHEQASYGPGDGNHRWAGSAAMDNQGNLAVGYSTSGSSTFPALRYSGRLVSDPPGGLFQGEASMVEGTGIQAQFINGRGRWGDYSALTVDPTDDCTFWYTNEYYTLESAQFNAFGWLTRIGAFKFPDCTPPVRGTLLGSVTDAVTGAPIPNAYVATDAGYSRVCSGAGGYSMTVQDGTYVITASSPGYDSSSVSGVVVTNGNTTQQDFALNPTP